jgi:HEAT repeat protein
MMEATILKTKLFGDEVPLRRLVNDLTNQDRLVRWSAALELQDVKERSTANPLIRALTDNFPDVRREATIALGLLKDKRAIDPLITCLKDTDYSVRHAAIEALGRIGAKKALPFLRQIIEETEAQATLWMAGVASVVQIDPKGKQV